jgi:hypothetical protein
VIFHPSCNTSPKRMTKATIYMFCVFVGILACVPPASGPIKLGGNSLLKRQNGDLQCSHDLFKKTIETNKSILKTIRALPLSRLVQWHLVNTEFRSQKSEYTYFKDPQWTCISLIGLINYLMECFTRYQLCIR